MNVLFPADVRPLMIHSMLKKAPSLFHRHHCSVQHRALTMRRRLIQSERGQSTLRWNLWFVLVARQTLDAGGPKI